MKQSKKYAIHLDNLRRNSKLNVKSFCEDIVDPRNYRRYLSGDRNLSHDKISDFCLKLKISTTDFYYSAREQDKYEFQKINTLYKYIEKRDFKSFNREITDFKRDTISDIQNIRFYDYCLLRVEYELHKKKDDIIIRELSQICDYPNCIDKSVFDFVDLISIQLIAEIETKFNKEIAINKLLAILHEPKFIYTSSEANNIIPSIFSNTALFLLRMKRFNDSNNLATDGIKYSLRYSDISGLAHLYYTKAYSLLQLGKNVDAEKTAILCIMTAIIKDNDYEIEMFSRVLTKDFKINPLNLVSKYQKMLQNHNFE